MEHIKAASHGLRVKAEFKMKTVGRSGTGDLAK